jgi:uncharacterized membrane protein
MSRRLLGSKGNLGGQTRVYRTADGLEIDDSEDDRIFRKRVFWDEVLMVTLHRGRDVPFAILAVVAVGFLALMSFGIGMIELKAGILTSVLTWVPLLIYTVVRLTQGVATVSVYGRRTMARLSFPLRPARAREVYAEISAAARRRQDAARAAAMRKAPPAPVPGV